MIFFSILLFYLLGLTGLTLIVVDSKILNRWREEVVINSKITILGEPIYSMVTCHQCAGFWVGLFGSLPLLIWLPVEWNILKILSLPFMIFVLGGAISLLSVTARNLIDWLTLNIDIPIGDLLEQEDVDTTGN